ncbi:hypothetical protein RR42_s2822 [Cupriavidus basilensis]|uniref:Uncharacterized protein n=1 Tax=Cupriavidus basilensis TaxID=68895 RepID=A0A0C4YMY3_9BURK|nr:hypothetical protein RR42_s2822 [Cupriavidus basilensis]
MARTPALRGGKPAGAGGMSIMSWAQAPILALYQKKPSAFGL